MIARGLEKWLVDNGRPGGPVEPGVVAVTPPGNLGRTGVIALLHAAVAVPRTKRLGYEVSRAAVSRAVTRCFDLGREIREHQDRPVESISFPLFGAGHAGLKASQATSWLWTAVHRELCYDPSWRVHLTTWDVAETREVLAVVAAATAAP